jgi:hypothetical protein
MKKIRIAGLVVLLLMIFPVSKSFAQVEKFTNYDIDVYLTKTTKDADGNVVKKDTLFTLTSGVERVYVTQFSNYVRKVTFQVNPDHPIMNFAKPVAFIRLTMREDIDEDGVEDVITSNTAVLTSKGKISFLYHTNAKNKDTK